MYFAFATMIIATAVIISAMILWAMNLTRKSDHSDSSSVLNKFEPDTNTYTLTQMINFHKENGIVKYEL